MGRRRTTVFDGAGSFKANCTGNRNKPKEKPRRDSLAAERDEAHTKRGNKHAQSDSTTIPMSWKTMVEERENRTPQADMTPEARAAREDVLEFVERHPGPFGRMEAIAADHIAVCEARGIRVHLSMQYLVERTRFEGVRAGIGETFAINNNLAAGLVRYMVSLHPSWADYFDMRRSKADGAFEVEE